MRKKIFAILMFLLLLSLFSSPLIFAQAEVMAWGNIIGTRIDGELVKFETSARVVKDNWRNIISTAKEEQSPLFSRDNDTISVVSSIEDLSLTKKVTSIDEENFSVNLSFHSDSIYNMQGAYFCIELPIDEFADPEIILTDASEKKSYDMPQNWEEIRKWWRDRYNPVKSSGVKVISGNTSLEIETDQNSNIIVLKGTPFWGNPNTLIYFEIIRGDTKEGQDVSKQFKFTVESEADRDPIKLVIDPHSPGRKFDGIGGNFRLQDPLKDPKVIDYCLKNLNVTWGRVEMPWPSWHTDETVDPLKAAQDGYISKRVEEAMLMAQKLAHRGIPVIVSAWSAPDWAIVGERRFGEQEDGLRGNPLNSKKIRSIVKSIGSYLMYLKIKYGVEASMFSFNESDLGINIRQTGEEHAELIKTLGSHFASLGLSTKLLLGDNSDATTYDFTTPALNDPATHKYIGAISFHSWRGYDNWTLSIWNDIADELNIPLIVGEGSTDAAAHRYPQIFLESSYALNEIDVYLRIMNICQAKSILQWQLTSDYSVLTGDGIFDTEGPLKTTQRFWNLKQLGLTPKGSFYIPIKTEGSNISCAALGDVKNGEYVIHIVNNGANRKALLKGFPEEVKKVKLFVTDSGDEMSEIETISVENGEAEIELRSAAFSTLICTQ